MKAWSWADPTPASLATAGANASELGYVALANAYESAARQSIEAAADAARAARRGAESQRLTSLDLGAMSHRTMIEQLQRFELGGYHLSQRIAILTPFIPELHATTPPPSPEVDPTAPGVHLPSSLAVSLASACHRTIAKCRDELKAVTTTKMAGVVVRPAHL